MRLLLDTHILIWWLLRNPQLNPSSLSLLNNPANILLFSSVSAFEIISKVNARKLKLPTDSQTFISTAMKQGRIDELPLLIKHTHMVLQLPPIHNDPFDRMLIATAIVENLTFLTYDKDVRQYPVPCIS
jgi:PIN domain nuclease of toxin-antitoxin system